MARVVKNSNVKGFKVTASDRKRLVGIACSTLQELKHKACQKLQLHNNVDDLAVLLCDGTLVEDELYFQTLPPQSVLIIQQPGEKILSGVDIIYSVLKTFNIELLQTASKVKQFFDDDAQKKMKLLSEVFKTEKNVVKASLNDRSEDPEWFEDLETLAKTKEEYMAKRSSGRIQRYFYDAKDKIRHSRQYLENYKSRRHLESSLNYFYSRLQEDEFFSCYFDRRSSRGAMCDKTGLFVCQGLWNKTNCCYAEEDSFSDHRINPYISKELRVLFSTWNLDHRVERSRSIIPSLLKAAEMCSAKETWTINSAYFYGLFFGSENLKIVHIVCHDKNEHKTAVCDVERIIIKSREKQETRSWYPISMNRRRNYRSHEVACDNYGGY